MVYDTLITAMKIMDVIQPIGIHWIPVMLFLTLTYTFINDTLTLDGGSDFVEFGCDGNIILSGDNIVLWKWIGY